MIDRNPSMRGSAAYVSLNELQPYSESALMAIRISAQACGA
jgi:hypothetical protein